MSEARPTNEELIANFLRQYERKNTRASYGSNLRAFLRHYDGHILDADVKTVTEAVSEWREENDPAAATFNQFIASLKRLFWYCLECGLIVGKNPARHFRKKNPGDVIQPTPTGEDVEKIWELLLNPDVFSETDSDGRKIIIRDRALFALFVGLGLRTCEVLELRVGDFDLANERVNLPVTKGGAPSFAMIPSEATEIFADFLRGRDKKETAVVGSAGKPITERRWYNTWSRQLCEYAGVRAFSPHAWRRWAGTRMIAERGLYAAQKLLRHSSPQTTIGYDAGRHERPRGSLGLPRTG